MAGVIVSIGLLTWQLNQANSVARFTAGTEIMRHYNEINLQQASDPDFAELMTVLSDDQAVLTKVQAAQATGLAYWLKNCWGNAELGYREGWISENSFQATLNDVANWTKDAPGLKPILRGVVRDTTANRQLSEVDKRILKVTEGN